MRKVWEQSSPPPLSSPVLPAPPQRTLSVYSTVAVLVGSDGLACCVVSMLLTFLHIAMWCLHSCQRARPMLGGVPLHGRSYMGLVSDWRVSHLV